MSELAKCKKCKGTGFTSSTQINICDVCHGSGRQKKRQRGYHRGNLNERAGTGTSTHCIHGHLRTGTGIDDNGNIRKFCEVCHNKTTNETKRRRKLQLT